MATASRLESLLALVSENGASDLHLAEGRHPIMRVASELLVMENQPELSQDDMMAILRDMLSAEQLERLTGLEEIDFGYHAAPTIPGKELRLRGNAFIRSGRLSAALRVIERVRTLAELHLPEALADIVRREQGFFLVVGPVGQGKSTTLAALVDQINIERKEHIVTIESPIEYLHRDKLSIVDQREVGLDTRAFDKALESVFRQDVNVIMIGEMRSAETMRTAVTAAETGHLVLSTLHTNTASQTIDRIIDSFPHDQQAQVRAQLAASLIGVFSERLLPSMKGGLVPAYELLLNTTGVANLIREAKTHEIDTLIETGTERGMVTMNHSLLELVRSGDISIENARRYSLNPKGLEGAV